MADICQCCGQAQLDIDDDHPVWNALGAFIAALLLADMIRRANA